VNFVGYLYIMDLNNVRNMEHIKINRKLTFFVSFLHFLAVL